MTTMASLFVIATGILILALMSAAANRKFRDRDRLPMQWSLGSRVNWSAPRPLALAFTPALAAVVMVAIALLPTDDPATRFRILVAVAAAFVGVHLLHLRLLEKWPKS